MNMTTKIVFPILNDVWMDNGVETLYSILQNIVDKSFKIKIEDNSLIVTIEDFNEFKKKVGNAIGYIRSNLIVTVMDKEHETTKEVMKDYILIQEGKKIDGKVAFKESLYNPKTVMSTTSEVFDLMVKDGKRNCVICGKSFSTPIKKLQQASYPFVTKIKSLSGIRSYKNETDYSLQEYYDDFCPTCYLRGIIEWSDDAIIYSTTPREKSTLFLPQTNNIHELIKFKKHCRRYLNKNGRYQNIKEAKNSDKIENTPGTFSTLLCFYEKFSTDIQEDNPNKSWTIMDVPCGKVKNIKAYTLNIEESILDIMLQIDQFGIYSSIIKAVSFFNNKHGGSSVNWKLTSQLQEDLSRSFIENDFCAFANVFLPQKGGKLGFSTETREYFEIFIYKWRFENMGLDKETFEMLKLAGKTIAAVSKSHQSLLYKLDKAKDKSALLDTIRQVSRRIVGLKPEEKEKCKSYIYPPSLEELVILVETHSDDRKFIEDLRNTLVIFSCVELSKLNYFEEKRSSERK